MLTDLLGNPIGQPPPEGHSMPEAAVPHLDKKGSTSPGGASSAYSRFIARRQLQTSVLKKETANDQLVERALRRLDAIDTYLTDDEVWFQKLEKANIRDIAIMEGVYIDKIQSLRGQATTIIGVQHQQKLDQVLPLLMQAMQQRGLKLEATERKVTATTA